MNYLEFEAIGRQWRGKVCAFGAGLIGQTWGYDLAVAAGFHIDFFCDNHIPPGTVLRDGISVISPKELYACGDMVLVLLTAGRHCHEEIQEEIKALLVQNGVRHILEMGDSFAQDIYFSLEREGSPALLEKYRAFMDDSEYLKKRFQYIMGYPLCLEHPKTFNEKLAWLKIHDRKAQYTRMVDKAAAKEYAASVIGRQYIVPTYGVWERFEDIDFESLPNQFVLKTTHDSDSTVLCKDKKNFDFAAAKKRLSNAMKYNYYVLEREWPYKNVQPRIIGEAYMCDSEADSDNLTDYKFFCFDGKPKLVMTVRDRQKGYMNSVHRVYDMDWNLTDLNYDDWDGEKSPEEKPAQFDEMLRLASVLSAGIKHLRVDLYNVDGKIYFGELTFSHFAGNREPKPRKWDDIMGSYVNLDD